jgi:hypothetical protein
MMMDWLGRGDSKAWMLGLVLEEVLRKKEEEKSMGNMAVYHGNELCGSIT